MPRIAEGFSPTAKGEYRLHQPDGMRQPAQAGFVLASRGLQPDGMRQPAQAGFAPYSRGLQPDGKGRIPDLMLNLHQPDGMRQPAQAGFALHSRGL